MCFREEETLGFGKYSSLFKKHHDEMSFEPQKKIYHFAFLVCLSNFDSFIQYFSSLFSFFFLSFFSLFCNNKTTSVTGCMEYKEELLDRNNLQSESCTFTQMRYETVASVQSMKNIFVRTEANYTIYSARQFFSR